VRPKGFLGSIRAITQLRNQQVFVFIQYWKQHDISLFPRSFPAKKIALVREQMQAFANFALKSAQSGPY